jgi:hypothetical protein
MQTFTFRCMDGTLVSVEAADERAARSAVMEKRWGPPALNYTWPCFHYDGRGLILTTAA